MKFEKMTISHPNRLQNCSNMKCKKSLFHTILIIICILCIAFIFYWRGKTLVYYFYDIDLYIDEISEDKIIVKSLPGSTRDVFAGEYIIQLNDDLIISDSKGGVVDLYSLERGDILLFDYYGPLKIRNGTILNEKKINAYNFRLSEEKLNLKFWRLG